MTPGVIADAYRWFSLLPHFKGKSRLEALMDPLVPLPQGQFESTFPLGFRMLLRSASMYERGVYFRNCEPDTCALFQRLLRRGDRFLDCGANLGFYTLLAARCVGDTGHVDAFEPTPSTFARLRNHVEMNGFENITLHSMALGAEAADAAVLSFSDDNHGMNVVTLAEGIDAKRVSTCRVDTLDGLLARGVIQPPNVMKVDVEGSELSLLKGAENLLREHSPFLVIELSQPTTRRFGYTPEDLVEYVRSLGDYVLEYPALGRVVPVPRGDRLPHYKQIGVELGANYVFRPAQRDPRRSFA